VPGRQKVEQEFEVCVVVVDVVQVAQQLVVSRHDAQFLGLATKLAAVTATN
jgi:hypothetical protein